MINGTLMSVPFDQILPYALQKDRRIVILASVVAEQLRINAQLIRQTDGIFYRIGELDERVLDMLATDLHVDWYDYGASVEEKRDIIQSSIFVHRHMGTPSAIYRVIEDVFGEGIVEEWFQYNGQPNCFKVKTEQAGKVSQNLDMFLDMIGKAKPVSQQLEHVTVMYGGTHMAKIGIAERRHYTLSETMPAEEVIANWLTDEAGEMLTDELYRVLI